MSQKTKKKSIWHNCDVCHSKFSGKDLTVHVKKSCPPADTKWIHPYVKEKTLFTSLEEMDETALKDMQQIFPKDEIYDIVWLSREVLRLSHWNVGDPVIIVMKGRPVVKTAWPYKGKSLMGASMIRENIDSTWGVRRGEVTIRHLSTQPPSARQIIISAKTSQLDRELDCQHLVSLLRGLCIGKYIFIGTKIYLPFYGKKLLVVIKSVIPDSDCVGDVTLESMLGETLDSTFISEQSFPQNEMCASTPKRSPQPITGSTLWQRESPLQDSDVDGSRSASMCNDASKYSQNISSSLKYSVQELEKDLAHLSLGHQDRPDVISSLCKVTETSEFIVDIGNRKDENCLTSITEQLPDIRLYGLEDVRKQIENRMTQVLVSSQSVAYAKKQRGILLYGPSGTGKTAIVRSVAREVGVPLLEMQSADIYSKFLGETECRIKEFFDDAKSKQPAIILLDKIDWLSLPNLNTSGATDLARRAVDTLALNLDNLQENNDNIVVVATACSLDAVDSNLRRPGRFDCEVEMRLPHPKERFEILDAFLQGTPNSLSKDDILSIANCTHAFVGGDLISLGSHALLHMSKMNRSVINHDDFAWALRHVSPSAMKEVFIDVPNVRWTDIAGQEGLKLKLRQSVEWPLTHPEAFLRMGIRPPRGILMYGPPGCSKTMIAKAVATESKLNFISIKGSEMFSKWVGESERAVREVFRRARQVAPSIVFFDELDAIGGERFISGGGTRNVESRVLTQLLTEMDGVEDLEKVIVIGATNRPDRIDKALLRPGRMDNIVYVPLPDDETRKEIFRRQFTKMPISFSNLDNLVNSTAGYSGAEVVAICHEAGRKALMEDINAQVIEQKHFNLALEEIKPRTPSSLLKVYEDYQKSRI